MDESGSEHSPPAPRGTPRRDSPAHRGGSILEPRFIDAAYEILRKHFDRLKASEAGTKSDEDPEALHAMRVSTRRLRAALRTFGPAFSTRVVAGHDRHLSRIARVLGEVRDLDVYLARLPEYAALIPAKERDALAPYEAWLRSERERARARMLRFLATRRYRNFLDRFERFLQRGAPRNPGRAKARSPVLQIAPRRIRKELRRVLRDGRAIPARHPPAEDLHRLRIRVKRLRYTCEFFVALYGPPMKRFVQATVTLQDLLGSHQDACMAGAMLRRFVETLPINRKETVNTVLALGRLIEAQDLAAIAARRRFRRVFSDFDRKKTRRTMFDSN